MSNDSSGNAEQATFIPNTNPNLIGITTSFRYGGDGIRLEIGRILAWKLTPHEYRPLITPETLPRPLESGGGYRYVFDPDLQIMWEARYENSCSVGDLEYAIYLARTRTENCKRDREEWQRRQEKWSAASKKGWETRRKKRGVG